MKVVVIGTRGIPRIQGGIETHCEKLYPILASYGYDITIVRRTCYLNEENNVQEYKGVKIKDINAPRKKNTEAILHTLSGVLYAKRQKADILHIHAIGPALLTPLARLLGLKVVVTHHGPDYNRKKWGKFAKFILKLGEKCASKCAHQIIAISHVIADEVKQKYNRKKNISVIYNGVNIPKVQSSDNYIKSLGLEKGKYIFSLGRFVEEKGFHNLIEAYSKSECKKCYKLVIAGDADHENAYSLSLKEMARKEGVVLTGFIKGEDLKELFSHAALFVLPSFHEGLPISLLEAMSYNLDVLVSNIEANNAIITEDNNLFNPSSIDELCAKLNTKLSLPPKSIKYDLSSYNWEYIAKQTKDIYENLLK